MVHMLKKMAANKELYPIPTYDKWSPTALVYHPLQAGSIDGTDLYPHDKGVLRAMRSSYRTNKRVMKFVFTVFVLFILKSMATIRTRSIDLYYLCTEAKYMNITYKKFDQFIDETGELKFH